MRRITTAECLPAGTLTTNVMTVTQAYTVDHGIFDVHHKPPMLGVEDSRSRMFLVGNLCNHSHMDRSGKNVGQATEVALMNVLSKVGLSDERKVRSTSSSTEHKSVPVTEYRSVSYSSSLEHQRSHSPPTPRRSQSLAPLRRLAQIAIPPTCRARSKLSSFAADSTCARTTQLHRWIQESRSSFNRKRPNWPHRDCELSRWQWVQIPKL